MKYKNYKSAIHNFAHSFQSLDYMKSPKQSFNVLVDLANLGLEPKATFKIKRSKIVNVINMNTFLTLTNVTVLKKKSMK